MGIDNLIPDRPSGHGGACRSRLSMAGDAAGLASGILVPPIGAAGSALIKGGIAAANNLAAGRVGSAAGSLAASVPAAVAGFFGGGIAADVVQGTTNEVAAGLGGNRDHLPDSSAGNLMQDATCVRLDAAVPAPPPKLGPTKVIGQTERAGWTTKTMGRAPSP